MGFPPPPPPKMVLGWMLAGRVAQTHCEWVPAVGPIRPAALAQQAGTAVGNETAFNRSRRQALGSKAQFRVNFAICYWEAKQGHLPMPSLVEWHMLSPLRSYMHLATWPWGLVNILDCPQRL